MSVWLILLVSYIWQQPEQMNISKTRIFTTGKTSSLCFLTVTVTFLSLDTLASMARNCRDELIHQVFCPLCSFMCRARTEFIFNLATFFLNPFPPYPQQPLPLEAIHINPLGLLPKELSGSVNQGYASLTFVTRSACLWKESKNTFLISQLPMDLCHSITLWSSYMISFGSHSP